ncbi:MraY family glycosyltransferase [Allochromatium vinosum]|uniref:Glycosyl transferase, family 4, conserved region n=1 Tax=Allochromatium vinosum (strain ATCC 17899 / DSM 180 / NBRC 103801 / NCIMB 10441 / D) TaxID=572477 RepID=D3RRL1_ALLVD|nr:glycosyltransferase family 4 protein [Allochromatium vinosum]ADC63923.1 Glycosyl transferase, family 4, conserved region [Allochromatium vinosum DSM 180]
MSSSLAPLAFVSLAALVLSLLLTRWLATRAGSGFGPLDHPNERSLHAAPVPRSGGLGVLAGVLLTLLAAVALGWMDDAPASILGALLLVALVSFRDDLGDLSPLARLTAHGLAAGALLLGGLGWSRLDLPGATLVFPGWLALVLTLLFVVWMINLYNFMDGMDGLAGGMAVFGFLALAWLGWRGEEPGYVLVCLGVAASAGGFLASNFPPARIFLGDVGSSSLGLLAAALALWGTELGLFPLWVAWLVFSPFIVDATWTLVARLIRGERVWEAHRSHHYQRLVLAGWSHRRTVLRAYGLMGAVAVCAVAAPGLTASDQWMLLGAWAVIYGVIHLKVGLVERNARMEIS